MINLIAIKEKHGWTKKYLADILFPMNAHPVHAIDRVLRGDTHLDENQILLLAAKIGCNPGDLFTEANWKAEAQGLSHTFTNGKYVAKLDLETMKIEFFVEGTLKHETILASSAITTTELLTFLNKLK